MKYKEVGNSFEGHISKRELLYRKFLCFIFGHWWDNPYNGHRCSRCGKYEIW